MTDRGRGSIDKVKSSRSSDTQIPEIDERLITQWPVAIRETIEAAEEQWTAQTRIDEEMSH